MSTNSITTSTNFFYETYGMRPSEMIRLVARFEGTTSESSGEQAGIRVPSSPLETVSSNEAKETRKGQQEAPHSLGRVGNRSDRRRPAETRPAPQRNLGHVSPD